MIRFNAWSQIVALSQQQEAFLSIKKQMQEDQKIRTKHDFGIPVSRYFVLIKIGDQEMICFFGQDGKQYVLSVDVFTPQICAYTCFSDLVDKEYQETYQRISAKFSEKMPIMESLGEAIKFAKIGVLTKLPNNCMEPHDNGNATYEALLERAEYYLQHGK